MKSNRTLRIAAVIASTSVPFASVVAAPWVPAKPSTEKPLVTEVRWRGYHHGRWRHGYGRYGWGPAVGGIAAGAVIGSAIANSRAQAVDNDAYCSQRFRSYDPRSGTYLGYDGMRHPCP